MTNSKERLAEGARLEKSGDLAAAAVVYRKIADKDPLDQEATGRLLIVYRKLKDYLEELAVINRVLAAYEEQGRARQAKWLRAHSKAAAAGTAVFQKLGGATVSGFGADPAVATLTRRRAIVERKISGKKGGKRIRPKDTVRKKEERQRQEATAEQRKREKRERQEAAAARRRQEAERREAEKAAVNKVKEAAAKAAREKAKPSLFVIALTYRAPLAEIDAAMAAHITFLDKHYEKEDFLVSGRQVPRTGGIILARGRDREAVERMMQADPLIKKKLATIEVVEFKASQMSKGLARLLA